MNLAIDIVLLPETPIAERAISLNGTLPDSEPIRLHATECLPHLSLTMGVIAEADLPLLSEAVRSAAARVPDELVVDGLVVRVNSSGRPVSSWSVTRSDALLAHHEEVSAALAPYRQETVERADFATPPEVDDAALEWVRHFETRSSDERFDPHITLGYGALPALEAPFSFRARSLAVCRLGASCTCRGVLREVELDWR